MAVVSSFHLRTHKLLFSFCHRTLKLTGLAICIIRLRAAHWINSSTAWFSNSRELIFPPNIVFNLNIVFSALDLLWYSLSSFQPFRPNISIRSRILSRGCSAGSPRLWVGTAFFCGGIAAFAPFFWIASWQSNVSYPPSPDTCSISPSISSAISSF